MAYASESIERSSQFWPVTFRGGANYERKGRTLNEILQDGQHIALRVATGPEEKEFSGVVRSFDRVRGLISLEIEGQAEEQMSVVLGKEATIVGGAPDFDLDVPCIVDGESRFPILVCQKVDRRNYVRVNVFLPLKYRTVDRELYEADPEGYLLRVQEEMGNHESPFEGVTEEVDQESLPPKLLCFLTDINRKLDRILAILEEEPDFQPQGAIAVNISGSGLRFRVREKMGARKLLAIRIVLPLSPPVPVVFLGEVTRVREKGRGEFETAMKFVAIDEADREQIVHYAFKRMRKSIRNRKKKRGQM